MRSRLRARAKGPAPNNRTRAPQDRKRLARHRDPDAWSAVSPRSASTRIATRPTWPTARRTNCSSGYRPGHKPGLRGRPLRARTAVQRPGPEGSRTPAARDFLQAGQRHQEALASSRQAVPAIETQMALHPDSAISGPVDDLLGEQQVNHVGKVRVRQVAETRIPASSFSVRIPARLHRFGPLLCLACENARSDAMLGDRYTCIESSANERPSFD